jgi:hypothetical protein
MNKDLPIYAIGISVALLTTIALVNTVSAQSLGEFTLIISLLNNANFKNQGQCVSQLPQLISNAHIAPDLSEQQIKEIAKNICKQTLPT